MRLTRPSAALRTPWIAAISAVVVCLPSPVCSQEDTVSGEAAVTTSSQSWRPPPLDPEIKKRFLPIWADSAARRGIELPRTFGIGLVGATDRETVLGDDLSIRLANGEPPPVEAGLIEIPTATVEVEGDNRSLQLKADAWFLPFLNLFVAVGTVEGSLDVAAEVDVDEFLPPLICRPLSLCGVQGIAFETDISSTTTTFGGTAVYGSERWFVAFTGAHTTSVGKNRTDVKVKTIGLRGGPRIVLDRGIVLEPYFGITYSDTDTRVTGTARARRALPGDEDLAVRYDLHISNEDKYLGAVGLNAELGPAWDVLGEYSTAGDGGRFVLGVTRRF
jgi:hypothetical protein